MDLGPLRALALDLNLRAHGVPITATPLNAEEAIDTRGIWVTPVTEDVPSGLGLQSREGIPIMALRRDDFPNGVPRGSLIRAPKRMGDEAILNWRVDGTDTTETDKIHVFLIRAPEE